MKKELQNIVLSENRRLVEISLSRVWQISQPESGRLFAILTAFRGTDESGNSLSRDENLQRNAELRRDIRNAGFGFSTLEGHWIENIGTPRAEDVTEESFLISLPLNAPGSQEKLNRFVLDQIRKWNQDAAIIKDDPSSDSVELIYPNGSKDNIGKFSPQKVSQAYSRLHKEKGGKGRTFVFEKEILPSCWSSELLKKYKK